MEVVSFLIHGIHANITPIPFKSLSEFHYVSARAAFLRDEVVTLLPGRTLISLKGLMEEGRQKMWEGWADRVIEYQEKKKRDGGKRDGHERLKDGEPRLRYFYFENGDIIGVLFQLHSINAEVLRGAGGEEAGSNKSWWKGGCCPL